jgi:hypothetical protein
MRCVRTVSWWLVSVPMAYVVGSISSRRWEHLPTTHGTLPIPSRTWSYRLPGLLRAYHLTAPCRSSNTSTPIVTKVIVMRLSMTKLLILLLSPLSPIVTSLPHERLASSRFAFRSSSSTVASTSQYGISGFTKYSAHPGAIKGSDPILKAKLENKDRNLKKCKSPCGLLAFVL